MLTPRRFVSVRRTVDPSNHWHVLDAIADDGSAWWLVIDNEGNVEGWLPLDPLPASSPPD